MQSLTAFLLATILALALAPAPQSQKKAPPEEKPEEKMGCGTVVTPEELKAELARKADLARKNIAPTAMAPSTDADDDILNDDFFNLPKSNWDALRSVNNVPNTINVYFTNLQDNVHGVGTFTTNNTQGILLNYQTFINPADSRGFEVFAHEMGHYFDLYHTHHTWLDSDGYTTGVECPSGENCKTAGDLLCDTPADFKLGPDLVDYKCAYVGTTLSPVSCKVKTTYTPLPGT